MELYRLRLHARRCAATGPLSDLRQIAGLFCLDVGEAGGVRAPGFTLELVGNRLAHARKLVSEATERNEPGRAEPGGGDD